MHLAIPQDSHLATTSISPNSSTSSNPTPTTSTTTSSATLEKCPPTITYCTAPQSLDDLDDSTITMVKSSQEDNTLTSLSQVTSTDDGYELHRCESGKLCTHTIIDSVRHVHQESSSPSSSSAGLPEESQAAPCMPTIVVESQPDDSNMADARIVILGARQVGKSGK